MIRVFLFGGLGNQMFQYAAGKALATAIGNELILDLGWFKQEASVVNHTIRHYGLDAYRLSRTTALSSSNWQASLRRRVGLRHPILTNLLLSNRITDQEIFSFNKNFFSSRGNLVLDGYFQHSDYFRVIEQQLRSDFALLAELPQPWDQFSYKLMNCDSVALHVRRGDYVTNQSAAVFHGTPGLPYYRQAIQSHLKERRAAKFYCFSDDIKWCQENLCDFEIEFVDTGDLPAPQVLNLMSKARHQVISNSTFSWWAGWLNNYPHKIIYCPEYWLTNLKTRSTGLLYDHRYLVID